MSEGSDLKHDKLTEILNFRVPEVTKRMVEELPASWKKRMNTEVLIKVCEVIHRAAFDPNVYLSDDHRNANNVKRRKRDKVQALIDQLTREIDDGE